MNLDAIDTQPWWQSRGVIGGMVTSIVSLLALLGYNLGDIDLTALVNNIVLITTAAAGILALVGRIRATKRISGTVVPPAIKAAIPAVISGQPKE